MRARKRFAIPLLAISGLIVGALVPELEPVREPSYSTTAQGSTRFSQSSEINDQAPESVHHSQSNSLDSTARKLASVAKPTLDNDSQEAFQQITEDKDPPSPKTGDRFLEVLDLSNSDEDWKRELRTRIEESNDSEALLIGLLEAVAEQCLTESSKTRCEFYTGSNYGLWQDMVPLLQQRLARGEIQKTGVLFHCAYQNLIGGTTEREYFRCLEEKSLDLAQL